MLGGPATDAEAEVAAQFVASHALQPLLLATWYRDQTAEVSRLYLALLAREPDAPGLLYHVGRGPGPRAGGGRDGAALADYEADRSAANGQLDAIVRYVLVYNVNGWGNGYLFFDRDPAVASAAEEAVALTGVADAGMLADGNTTGG